MQSDSRTRLIASLLQTILILNSTDMKKSLLTAFAGCALCASANATEWTADIIGIFDTDGAVYAAQTAVAADGSVIAAGAFNAEATILGNAFEPVGTSAYIAKYNADGTAAW